MPVQAFVSYSHRDERFLRKLESHLAILKRQGLLEVWHDRKIVPGSDLHGEIDRNLEHCRVVLLLVSPDFIASDYCYAREMSRAMSMHEEGQASVVPIIVRPVDWAAAPFAKLTALPRDGKPITSWKNRDEAYLDVARGLRSTIEMISSQAPRDVGSAVPLGRAVDAYQGSVVQVGGIGSRLVTKTAWLVTEHGYLDAEQFITHFFNGGGDILWVSCPPDFSIDGATSPSGNSVFAMDAGDRDTPYGLLLKDQLQNKIVISCSRKPEEQVDVPRATGTLCPQCNAPMGPFQQYCVGCGFHWPEPNL